MENKQIPSRKRRISGLLTRYAPPGMNTDREVKGYITGLVMMFVFSLEFVSRFHEAYDDLFYWIDDEKVLRTDAVMRDFSELLDDSLRGFFLYCFVMLMVVAWHYLYYYQGSKSIYLMRRLPNPLELHKRAWVLPLLGAVVTLIAAFVVLVLYFEIYMIVTPEQCITPGQWQNIWR